MLFALACVASMKKLAREKQRADELQASNDFLKKELAHVTRINSELRAASDAELRDRASGKW